MADILTDLEDPDYLRPRLMPLAEIVAFTIYNIRNCLDPDIFIIDGLPECLSGEFLKMINSAMAKFEHWIHNQQCRIELALQSPDRHEKALLVQVLNRILKDIKLKTVEETNATNK
jgi:hypothetical protein